MRIPHGLRAAAGAAGGSVPWEVAGATFDGSPVNYYWVGDKDTNPQGITFKDDGTKMYIMGNQLDRVYEYNLSPAWDVTSASYVQDFSVTAQETNPTGVFFKSDGTYMYVVGSTGDDIIQYSLSSAWDVSSATYDINFVVSAQENAPSGVSFKPDGTKMYVCGSTGDDVNEYNLSTAWDVSSASYVQNFSVAAQETVLYDVFFKPDGTKMYVTGGASDSVHEYDLSTAWDVSTASYLQSFSVQPQESNPTGLYFKDDGTELFIIGSGSDTVFRYQLSSAWDVSTASFTYPTPDYVTWTYSLARWAHGLDFKPDGTTMFTVGVNNLTTYTLSTPWDVTTASFVSDLSINENSGIHFKPDGTYAVGSNTGSGIWSYQLSTPWDISSAGSTYFLSFAAIDVYMRDDGLKLYVCSGYIANQIREYNLSTAWDVSTASLASSFSAAGQDTSIQGVHLKPDGTKMYLAGLNSRSIHQYDLGTAWDISTATWVDSRYTAGAEPKGIRTIRFKDDDGTKFFTSTDTSVVSFNM